MNKTAITILNLLLVLFFSNHITASTESAQDTYNERIVNIGNVSISKPLQSDFSFSIDSDTPYTIKDITTSCECISIISYKETIQPHSLSTVKFLFLPDITGDFAYEIKIIPDSPQHPEYTFLMMITVYDDGLSPAKNLLNFAPEMLTRVIRDPAQEYYISANKALRMIESNSATFVDIRQTDEYNLSNIPNSINMPLYAIKTKPFLRNNPIILINKGTSHHEFEEECAILRKAGFEVYILDGGLNYWNQCQYPLSGNYFDKQNLKFIDPIELYMDRHYSNWLVVDVSSNQEEELPLIPDCLQIPLKENKTFADTLRNHVQELSSDNLVSVAIISDTPEDYEKAMLLSSGIKNIQFYYVDGGKEAYKEFILTQTLMRYPPQHTKRHKTCGTCPQEEVNKVMKN